MLGLRRVQPGDELPEERGVLALLVHDVPENGLGLLVVRRLDVRGIEVDGVQLRLDVQADGASQLGSR